MRLSRIAAVTLIVALAIATVGAGPALASTKRFSTTVTIKFVAGDPYHADKFKGKTKSKKSLCKKNRKVTVFRKKSGPDAKYGTDKTNKKGNYVVKKDTSHARSGKYYAKAKKKTKKKANGNKIVCQSDRSKTITVP